MSRVRTPADLLREVEDTDADYHDGLDGWLTYRVDPEAMILEARFEPASGEPAVAGRWRLTPVGDAGLTDRA